MNKYQDLSEYKNPPDARGRANFVVILWWIFYGLFFRLSPKFMWGFRRYILRLFGAKVGSHARFNPKCKITYPWFLITGDYCWVGDETVIYNLAPVSIGNHVALAHRVYLCTGSHNLELDTFDLQTSPIVIEDEVWIANDVFVAPGVSIGRGAVIAARSNVFKDVPGGYIYSGPKSERVRKRTTKKRSNI